ncbi:hypothetical protein KC316_g4671 [Hortaea werneckii]|nr:hypothetical protein KC316_g4671 [Hortaea werneckii]
MQNLVTVPKDIKHYILQFLTDSRDLYNLNLTCQELRHNALPFYYNTIHVNGNVDLPVLAAGLVPTNPGLQHLRHLVIKEPYRDDPIECQCQQCPLHSNTYTALTLLANLLPYDRLLTFTCDYIVPLPFPVLATLYRRQPKLRTLRLDSIHLDPVIASLSQDRLANIATVYICTSDPGEASVWNGVLPTLCNLRNLEVIASADRFDGVYPLTADASSQVLAKLLDWTSQESHYKLHLHTLQILGIQLCANSVRLLEVLYETHELESLNLRTLTIIEAKKNPESQVHNPALSRLLSTFSSLRRLRKLEQFALSMPNIVLAEADHVATARSFRQMRNLLNSLNALPSLHIVQMLDMELGDWGVEQNDRQVFQGYILRQMRIVADYIFKAVSNLRALSLEQCIDRDAHDRCETHSEQYYHRGRTFDAQGREQATAIEASLQGLKQIEPAVVILAMEDLEDGDLFRYGYDL